MLKVTGANYYEALPPSQFGVGDIWDELPSFGHMGCVSTKGIVVTPACDLANRKVETLTYLPVISLSDYLIGRSFSVEILRILKTQVKSVALDGTLFDGLKGVALPCVQAMGVLARDVALELNDCKDPKRGAVLERILSAIKHLVSVRTRGADRTVQCVRRILSDKEFDRAIREIVRNSYSVDLHFLPGDGRVADMSVIKAHSVVLFRYAMSIPVEFLEAAQDTANRNWAVVVEGLSQEFPVAKHVTAKPLRVGRLKAAFIPDLISRFTSLHVRMGSPDFSPDTINEYVTQIGDCK